MKKLSLKAKCLCGNISFKTSGYHRDVQNCHCVQCLKTHGHHAAYSKVEEKDLKFLSKQTASSSATISFTSNIDSTYDAYMFKLYNIQT